jgi:hypothetical protein
MKMASTTLASGELSGDLSPVHSPVGVRIAVAALSALALASTALAQWTPPPLADPPADGGMFQWATVGALNNPAYNGTPGNPPAFGATPVGRGSVNYAYRISRTELTHGQYLPFINSLLGNPATVAALGARFGSRNVTIDGSGQIPDGFELASEGPNDSRTFVLRDPGWTNVSVQLTWRMAALYCNWMHNGRGNTVDAFITGAYNTDTWSRLPNGTMTDEASRLPGARFFMPTISERMKAAHYDPNRFGPGQGGYWLYGNRTDAEPIYSFPGVPDSQGRMPTATYAGGFFNPVPVGVLADQQSPWGLWDAAGGWSEWCEGSAFGGPVSGGLLDGDRLDGFGSGSLWNLENATLRIASVIPAPSSAGAVGVAMLVLSRRRR